MLFLLLQKSIQSVEWKCGESVLCIYDESSKHIDIKPIDGKTNVDFSRSYNETYEEYFDDVETIKIYDGVNIADNALERCSSLKSISIPNNVTSIGCWAFKECSSLTSINIPDNVTSIGEGAFFECSSLTSINIPNGVTSIGESAFYKCFSLTSINISNTVTSIGEGAFESCSSLTTITIPNSVESIGEGAFCVCSSLTTITIPSSVISIGRSAFSECSSLTSINVEEGNEYYKSEDGILFSKDGRQLIQCPPGIKSDFYTVPSPVTKIGDSAFEGCSSLTTIEIPNGVTEIGEYAFCECTSLITIDIPNSVTEIGEDVFCYCTSLTTINIPNSVTSIGDYAFKECSSLTSIDIPNSVTSIGYQAFGECSSLTTVNISNSVTSIGQYAFAGCSLLTTINIPNSVKSIGLGTFCLCSSLTSINIPNSVKSISKNAFIKCSSLASINIPDSVTSIGEYVFQNCSSLASINIPDSVTSIGKYAFSICPKLKTVTLPSYITSIEEYLFWQDSSLSSINISESVRSIRSNAFQECSSLANVYYYGTSEPEHSINIFSGCPQSIKIHVNKLYNGDTFCGKEVTKDIFIYSGKCGDNINYEIDTNSKLLTISGSGPMYDYDIDQHKTPFSYYAEYITKIVFSGNINQIGEKAFFACTNLTSVTIPSSVVLIGEGAFVACSSLASINVEKSNQCFKSINGVLFSKNGSKVVQYPEGRPGIYSIPSSVTSIGEYAFAFCTNLTSINIPYGTTSIGEKAFMSCTSLISIAIPDSVTSIEKEAFGMCSTLTNVYYYGTSEPRCEEDVFSGCTSLSNIHVSDSYNGATFCGRNITKGTLPTPEPPTPVYSGVCGDDVKYEIDADSKTLTISGSGPMYNYDNSDENVAPYLEYSDKIETIVFASTSSVTSIGDNAFSGCSSIKSITLPNSIIKIGDHAFSECTGARNLTIGSKETPSNSNSLLTIHEYAFYNCFRINTINISCEVDTISKGAFSCDSNHTSQLVKIDFENKVRCIEDDNFNSCKYLKQIIYNSTEHIDIGAAFANISVVVNVREGYAGNFGELNVTKAPPTYVPIPDFDNEGKGSSTKTVLTILGIVFGVLLVSAAGVFIFFKLKNKDNDGFINAANL